MKGEPKTDSVARLLIAPTRNLHIIGKQLDGLLTAATHRQLKRLAATMELFISENADVVFYVMENKRGGAVLCAVPADLNAQLRGTLWERDSPIILTSGTLAVGRDFCSFKEETGLLTNERVTPPTGMKPRWATSCTMSLTPECCAAGTASPRFSRNSR